MNKIIALIKSGYQFRRVLHKCKKHSQECDAYILGKFYKDQIEKLGAVKTKEDEIKLLISDVNNDMHRYQNSKRVTEVLQSASSFLTTLQRFA